jgi:hypothetical protein
MGDWLTRFAWTYWAHLSFERPQSSVYGVARTYNAWARSVARNTAAAPLGWFAAFEQGDGGRWHIHALVHTRATPRELRALWRHGHTVVQPYDEKRGGTFYIAKVVDDLYAGYEISDWLPPERR